MELPGYFWNGFQHAMLGAGFALLFQAFVKKNYFVTPLSLLGLITGSSALFFLPGHIGRYGSRLDRLYQFTHYPLSDWNILLSEIRDYWGKGWLMLNGMLLFAFACFIHHKFQDTQSTSITNIREFETKGEERRWKKNY